MMLIPGSRFVSPHGFQKTSERPLLFLDYSSFLLSCKSIRSTAAARGRKQRVGPTPSGQSCEDGKNPLESGNRDGTIVNRASLNRAPGFEIGQPSDIPLHKATLFRILSGQLPNVGVSQNPQMASVLKQYKGILNGFEFLCLV